jgi:hypothetical protein
MTLQPHTLSPTRGSHGRLFPWGDTGRCSRLAACGLHKWCSSWSDTAPGGGCLSFLLCNCALGSSSRCRKGKKMVALLPCFQFSKHRERLSRNTFFSDEKTSGTCSSSVSGGGERSALPSKERPAAYPQWSRVLEFEGAKLPESPPSPTWTEVLGVSPFSVRTMTMAPVCTCSIALGFTQRKSQRSPTTQ